LTTLDALDRTLINRLQAGLPICREPFALLAEDLRVDVETLLARVQRLRDNGFLSRFGPMYRVEALGGALALAAMAVPSERFDAVAEQLREIPEVAHNYSREHALNMWFVLAAEDPQRFAEAVTQIEQNTGLPVHLFPKQREYCLSFRVSV